jgi:tellurite resistance protein TerC
MRLFVDGLSTVNKGPLLFLAGTSARLELHYAALRRSYYDAGGEGLLDVPWYFYVAFLVFLVAMLLVDLRLFHAREHEASLRESATWVAVWVGLALVFGAVVAAWHGHRAAAEYFSGYLIEYSLSVDNMFVFVVIFSYFQVPRAYQHQVLFFGILGAIIFRGLFIATGTALINTFDWVIYVFGAFLIITAIRLARGGGQNIHPEENPVLKFADRRLPTTTKFYGQRLFTAENGRRVATPLFVTLLFIEVTDIIFAVDSIPAIFGITKEPFIVLTSNLFAVLGLRALYFLISGAMNRLHLLNYGLAVILAFVGTKMILEAFHIQVATLVSLGFIIGVLAVTTFLSLKIPPRDSRHDEGVPPRAT